MKIVYGPKGTGKTKIVIADANAQVDSAKGHVVFITDTNRYMYDLKYQIRFIDVKGYEIGCENEFVGFIKGIVAANSDNEIIYVDGIARITGHELSELGDFFAMIERLEKAFSVSFVFTCSAAKEDLPPFLAKYLD